MGDGLSRRDMIKGAAVAGAAAWTAPMIIDSLTSPAAAGSLPCTGTSVTMSWIYLLFTIPNDATIYVTGFSTGDTSCNGGGKYNGNYGTRCNLDAPHAGANWPACTSPTGYTITLNGFATNPPSGNDITYGTGGTCGSSTAWTFMNAAAGCGSWIQFDNGKINAVNGAKVLVGMGFGANEPIPVCPDSNSTNNQVCGIEAV